jgi:hypothetical protein
VKEAEKTALLARWKAAVECRGRGWPTDQELLDLMETAADQAVAEEREAQNDRCKEGRC